MNQPIITSTPNTYGRALNVLRENITVLAGAAATSGHEILFHQGDESVGPPPHAHPWDESFFVLRGEMVFDIAGKTVVARAGAFLHVPAGTVHSFRYGAGGAEALGVTGANSGASKLFADIDRASTAGPPALPEVVAILGRHGAVLAT
jgi:mannose-6-phosphate isomerase-like protein (cupin superfamily)